MQKKKTIAVLGASGSVGMQAIDVARSRGYAVDFISINKNVTAGEALAREFSPSYIASADIDACRELKTRLADTKTKVLFGSEGI